MAPRTLSVLIVLHTHQAENPSSSEPKKGTPWMHHCIEQVKFNQEMLRSFTAPLGRRTVRVAKCPSSSCMEATTSILTIGSGLPPDWLRTEGSSFSITVASGFRNGANTRTI